MATRGNGVIEEIPAGGGEQGGKPQFSGPGGGEIELSIVDTLGAFEDLRADWNGLMATAGRPDQVFQQHAWIWHGWRTYFGERAEAVVVVGRRRGRLAMIMPLVGEGRLGVRNLTWMGDPVSQYSDVLIEGEDPGGRDILRGLKFAGQACGADLLVAGKVRDGSALAAAVQAGGGRVIGEEIAPAISLHELSGLQDIEARFSAKMRRGRRGKRKLLGQAGRLDFRIVSEGPEALAAVASALSFKSDWIEKYAVVATAFGDPRFGAFWRSAAGSSQNPIGLAVAILEIEGRPAAIEVGLRHKGVHFAHIGAFDIAFEKCSPGSAQIDALLEACIADGIREYDMLAPNADYKRRLADRFVIVRDYVLPLTAAGQACDALRLTQGKAVAKMGLKMVPASVRKVIKSMLGV